MTKEDALSKPKGIISIIYQLTMGLAMELIRVGCLCSIIVGGAALVGLAFVFMVLWAYSTYDGSLFMAGCAALLGVVMIVVAAIVVEIVVKDILHLTDLPLIEVIKSFLGILWKSRKNAKDPGDTAAKSQPNQDERDGKEKKMK